MKAISLTINILLYIAVAILIISSMGTAITKEPLWLTTIRSNSMYPLFQRGDMLFISGVAPDSSVKIGDIVIFKAEEGALASKGWISHRIIGGDAEHGYITKGDANDFTDQADGTVPIKREWISSRVITIDDRPAKIPLLGYLPLWMEGFQKSKYVVPVIIVLLAAVLGGSEFLGPKKKKSKISLPLIYFFSGLTLSVIMCASMMATSQHLKIVYEVSQTQSGVIQGSNVGILTVGQSIERPLAELSNKGLLPMTAIITSDDPQMSFSDEKLLLKPEMQVKATFRIDASIPGNFETDVHVGMFIPILPSSILFELAKVNYWLALAIDSLISGLPVMIIPLFDGKLRRAFMRFTRLKLRGLSRVWS